MWIRKCLLGIFGYAAGYMVSGGVFDVLFVTGLVPRLAGKTATAKYETTYESMIIRGTIVGTIMSVFPELSQWIGNAANSFLKVWIQLSLLGVTGAFTGIYVGCLALAVADLFNSLPIMLRRAHIKKRTEYILLAIAMGKIAGAVIYFWTDMF